MPAPELATPRLYLRPFTARDDFRVELLAGERAVAEGCVLIPHPYPPGLAARWIASHELAWREQGSVYYAMTDREQGLLIGSISLILEERRTGIDDRSLMIVGQLGYWLGPAYWGQGLMTEAVSAVLALGFEELGMDRVEAWHTPENHASAKVMLKNGLRPCLEQEQQLPDGRYMRLCCCQLDWEDYRLTRRHNAAQEHPSRISAA